MSLRRAHIEHAKRVFFDRLGNPYVYGGMWSPTNLRQGTDCSGLWNDILAAATTGAVRWGREAEGATTESYRYVGGPGSRGPFGTIRAASAAAVPADAPVKIALHHGPGGGANSHMWGEVDGVRMESAGSKGTVTQPAARAFTDPYANDWFYLPGPIIEDGTEIVDNPNAVTWGIDISNHQGNMDLAQVKREGFDFIWVKVSEGGSYRDPFWPANRDNAKAAGLILAGYHYVRTDSPQVQAQNFVEHLGDTTIPAMLDFEDGSGGIDQFWAVKAEIEKLGVNVALSYIPDWYWERIGKPDLSQVPGLISSEYVSGSGYASVLYPGNNSSFWKAYGGRTPDVLQFTDRALVAGKHVDANAFRGTPDQLNALLGGQTGDDELANPEIEKMIREVHAALFNKIPSQSKYRNTDEGRRWQLHELIKNDDAMIHEMLVERQAMMGNPEAVALVKREADKGDKWAKVVLNYLTGDDNAS